MGKLLERGYEYYCFLFFGCCLFVVGWIYDFWVVVGDLCLFGCWFGWVGECVCWCVGDWLVVWVWVEIGWVGVYYFVLYVELLLLGVWMFVVGRVW